jgi:amino-acid N-acetyltransferase
MLRTWQRLLLKIKSEMQMATQIRPATAADYNKLAALLQTEQLPVVDIDTSLPHFFVATNGDDVIAGIGMEHYDKAALLRSMVTAPAWRGRGLASALVDTLFEYAGKAGVRSIYIVTTTAEEYFLQKGFKRIDRSGVDQLVLQSAEFNGLCPSSAAIMVKAM